MSTKFTINFYFVNRLRNLIQFSLILIILLSSTLFITTNVLSDDGGNKCVTRGGGKDDAEQVPVSFSSPTWAICLTNSTDMVLNYSKRWGPYDPWQTHSLQPNETRAHWCNPNRAQCIAPFMITWSDSYGQYNLDLDYYILPAGCVRCSIAKKYYFLFNGRNIYLSQ